MLLDPESERVFPVRRLGVRGGSVVNVEREVRMRYVRRFASVSVAVLVGLGSGVSLAQTKPATRTPVVNGIGDPRSVVQTPSFGTISEQIALALPPGRRNLLPKLNFTYVSAGGLDLTGLGWQLETGHVDRSLKDGVPSFTDADLF